MARPQKRIRKLSTAVFRGSRTEYSFDVFPISLSITDSGAVFIFSRRFVDKFGRAHHAVSCLGETNSLATEIKKHRRARCVKGSEANVVCVLKEPDRNTRSEVIADISAARVFSCIRGTYKPTIKSKLDAKTTKKAAKVLLFKPAANPLVEDNGSGRFAKPVSSKRDPKRVEKYKEIDQPKPAATANLVKGRASTSAKGIQSDVDSDSGQHRFSKPKRAVARRAKTGVTRSSRTRTKLAA